MRVVLSVTLALAMIWLVTDVPQDGVRAATSTVTR